MKIPVLEELRVAGYDVGKLLQHPSRFMSVAKIGPKKAFKIYKQLGGKPITEKELENIYHKVQDKKKFKGKKLQKIKSANKPAETSEKGQKAKYNLNILQHHPIPFQDILGEFKVILGTTGQGKSNTVAVLIEETNKRGLPTHLIDVEGEHKSFVDEMGFKLLDHNNYKAKPESKEEEKEESLPEDGVEEDERQYNPWMISFLKPILEKRESLLVDYGSFSSERQQNMLFLKDYLRTLWYLENKMKTPLSLVVEEVHVLVPQTGKTPVKDILRDFAKRGRKRKIEVTFVTQRSQEADKSVITQAETGFLHKVSHHANLEVYKDLIPDKELFKQIGTLQRGEVIFVNKGTAIRDFVRPRHTKHGSHTLSLEDLKIKQNNEAKANVI